MSTENFDHFQPMAGSDAAHTASAPSGITVATPALTPLMLSANKLVVWDGAAAGTAVGLLALALKGTETSLTHYKSGTFRLEDVKWPVGVAEDRKKTAFAGSALSIL